MAECYVRRKNGRVIAYIQDPIIPPPSTFEKVSEKEFMKLGFLQIMMGSDEGLIEDPQITALKSGINGV